MSLCLMFRLDERMCLIDAMQIEELLSYFEKNQRLNWLILTMLEINLSIHLFSKYWMLKKSKFVAYNFKLND